VRLIFFIWNLLLAAGISWLFVTANGDWVSLAVASFSMFWVALTWAICRDGVKYEGWRYPE
jgi:membrane protein YdbS with pleckstrin-like domain